MRRAAVLLLALALAATAAAADEVLVLKDGRKIPVTRLARRDGQVVFQTTKGEVFSVPESDVVSPPLASIPLWLAMLWGSSLAALLVLNMVLYGLAIMWVGPAAADIHDIAGPNLRGLGIGIFFSAVNLIAYGIGAPLIGRLNDVLGVAKDPSAMRFALLACPSACALAALLLWLGARASRPRPVLTAIESVRTS